MILLSCRTFDITMFQRSQQIHRASHTSSMLGYLECIFLSLRLAVKKNQQLKMLNYIFSMEFNSNITWCHIETKQPTTIIKNTNITKPLLELSLQM